MAEPADNGSDLLREVVTDTWSTCIKFSFLVQGVLHLLSETKPKPAGKGSLCIQSQVFRTRVSLPLLCSALGSSLAVRHLENIKESILEQGHVQALENGSRVFLIE